MKLISLFLFLLSFSFAPAQWLKEKGKGYYKLDTWSLLANKHFTDIGGVDPNATRGLFISSFFAHYGLSEKVNIIAYVPFFVKNYQFSQISETRKDRVYEPRHEFNSLGDINIATEIKIAPLGNWAFSTTLLFGLPTGKSVGGFDGSYQTGDGEFNQQLQFNFGKSYRLGKQPFYLKTYLGFNNRSGGFSDEVHSFIESGTQLKNRSLLVLTRLHWIKPLYNGTLDASNSDGAIFANNIQSLSLGGELAYNFGKHWGLSVALTRPLYGRVIYKGTSYSGGLFLNF